MVTPKVSWVMPVYNQEEFIIESINSIIEQTYDDFELIIVNDGSTDMTFDLISSIRDKRIKIINNVSNVGVSISLNAGIKASTGQYIARMDGDDISVPDRLEKQVGFMEANPEIVVCGSHVETMGRYKQTVKRPLGSSLIKCFMLAGPPFSHPSVMLRNSSIKKHNLYYDENIRSAQDYELWFRVLQVAPGWNLDEILLTHRVHDKQVSVTSPTEQDFNALDVRRKVLLSLGIDADSHDLDMHTKLFRNILELSNSNIDWSVSWIDTIIKKNAKAKVFETRTLNEFLTIVLNYYLDKSESSNVVTGRSQTKRLIKMLTGMLGKNKFMSWHP